MLIEQHLLLAHAAGSRSCLLCKRQDTEACSGGIGGHLRWRSWLCLNNGGERRRICSVADGAVGAQVSLAAAAAEAGRVAAHGREGRRRCVRAIFDLREVLLV